MNYEHHYVSGFFATHDVARQAQSVLVGRGLPPDQVRLYARNAELPFPAPRGDSNAVLKDVFVDGAIGTAVGTGLGALAEVALVAANVSLFIASPLLAPLVMMGWGASIGAVVGASVGATADSRPAEPPTENWLSHLVADAIASGQIVLVAETHTDAQTALAREAIRASVGAFKDTVAA